MIGRRLCILGAASLAGWPAAVWGRSALEVWRDPNCGCCFGWEKHVRAVGFAVRDKVAVDLAPIRRMLGTPANLISCRADRIDGYALEGHVPVAAIQRLLIERPAGVRGLAVPEMPIGSPGMEVSDQPDDIYDVIGFDAGQRRIPFIRFHTARAL